MYALWLDSMLVTEDGRAIPRHLARLSLDEVLARPLDADEAEEWQRERWGAAPGHMQEVLATEQLDIPTYE